MNRNEQIEAGYAKVESLAIQEMELEQAIVNNNIKEPLSYLVQQLSITTYEHYKARDELTALIMAPAKKKSLWKKLTGK